MSQTSFTFADLQGEPHISIGLELGIFIYITTQDGRWHVRWNGDEKGQSPITFFYLWGGDISASQITNVSTYRFDRGQPDNYSQRHDAGVDILNFNGVVFSDVDGLDFDVTSDQVNFELTGQIKDAEAFLYPGLIFLGPNKINPTANNFIVTQSAPPPVQNATLFWTNTGPANIQSATLTSPPSAASTPVNMPYTAYGLALDPSGQKLYWSDSAKTIASANLDGSDLTQPVTGLSFTPYGLALDLANNLIYTAATSTASSPLSTAPTGGIYRIDISSGQATALVSDLPFPVDVALDLNAGKIYWAEYNGGGIGCAGLDGSNVSYPITGLSLPQGIAIDPSNGKLYWADKTSIGCANLDGSDSVIVAALPNALGNNLSRRVALDAVAAKVYWTDRGAQVIQRADANGVNAAPETILSDLASPALLTPPLYT